MDVTIVTANPLDHADEIKRLFVTHGRPEFPAFFDRAYATAVRAGGRCWLGRDPAGRLVMHIACFPRRFRHGAHDVAGGLLMNAMVAEPYRSFFPARAMMQRARDDSRAAGVIDFLYTDPNDAARVVLEASGFRCIGTLSRHVLPVADRRWLVDRAIRVLHAGARLRGRRALSGPTLPAPVARSASEQSTSGFDAPWGESTRLRPHYGGGLYAARLEGYPGPGDHWFTFPLNGATSPLQAGLLVRGPDHAGVATLHAVRRQPGVALGSVLLGLVGALRALACTRLQVYTVRGSAFSAELLRAGFMTRGDATPLMAAALTPVGAAVLESVREWEITDLDCDR